MSKNISSASVLLSYQCWAKARASLGFHGVEERGCATPWSNLHRGARVKPYYVIISCVSTSRALCLQNINQLQPLLQALLMYVLELFMSWLHTAEYINSIFYFFVSWISSATNWKLENSAYGEAGSYCSLPSRGFVFWKYNKVIFKRCK